MRYRIFFLMLTCAAALFAQKNGTITGAVIDKESSEPLQNATLQLYSLPDSVFKVGTASDYDGKFSLSASAAEYYLKVSFVGYVVNERNIKVLKGKNLDLGNIELSTDAVALKAAVVTAEVPPVTAAEDTLIYNTAAFRVPAGSMLEELIKKYPGVDIEEDGTIKINGKTVNRILMKGKDFFGTDKDMALKNISADVVDKVKFYDKKSDFSRITGIDDGEEETVLDLQMKKGVVDGLFSNTDVGYGTKERYTFKNTTGYYNDMAQYTLVMSANNMNDQGFSDGRSRGFRGGGGGGGLVSPKQAGFNFAYENEKLELGGNVRANHKNGDSRNWTSSETFMPQIGRNQFSNSRSNTFSRSTGFNADLRLEWKPDTLTNIIFRPSVSYTSSDNWSRNLSATFNGNPFDYDKDYVKEMYGDVLPEMDAIAINRNDNESLGVTENRSASANLQVNRRLYKPGRNVTFRGRFSYSDSENDSYSINKVKYYQSSAGSAGYDRQRYSTTPGKNWSYDLRFSYTEPLAKNLFLQLNYSYSYSYNNSDRATYVLDNVPGYIMELSHHYNLPSLPNDYMQYIDNDLSRHSTYRTQKHEAQVMLRYVTDKMNLNAGVSWIPQETKMDYKYLGLDTVLTRNVGNIAPNVRFRYRWSKQTTLNVMYRGMTSQPSMTDLIDVTDDSNPLYITKGNPGLKPSFTNRVNAFFNTYNTEAQRGFNVSVGFSNTLNSISRKATYVEETGATITQPDNINGNWSVDGGFSFNSAVPANTKFTYNTFTMARYSNNVSYISVQNVKGSVKNKARTMFLSERLSTNYRTDNFDISLSGSISYSHSKSSAQPEDKMDIFNFSYGPSMNYTLPWYNIQISTNISMSSRRGYSDPSANTDELLWNAQLSASFLERNALTVSFQIFDILHEQSNISRMVDALSRRDSETNSIYSYCMFKLAYKFNNNAKGSDDKKGRGAREFGMPPSGGPRGGMPPGGMRGGPF